MHRLSRLLQRLLRPSREKLIRRQIAEFEKINPYLHKDIGLHENSFRELAERVVDQRYGFEDE
ncbi:hypothetical protein C2I36_08630 [Rhodobacteraceae bacterium WD3A24]|nr:hypothetical protein C2I36_08630 [Rhodobacteraceae bacterium WD3A24]